MFHINATCSDSWRDVHVRRRTVHTNNVATAQQRPAVFMGSTPPSHASLTKFGSPEQNLAEPQIPRNVSASHETVLYSVKPPREACQGSCQSPKSVNEPTEMSQVDHEQCSELFFCITQQTEASPESVSLNSPSSARHFRIKLEIPACMNDGKSQVRHN